MKELSIEEKAKRYDEAIKLAKDSFNYPDYPGFIRADVVFPELKEDEDERIRKALMEFLVGKRIISNDLEGINIDKTLAWLEKQGELINSLSKGLDNAHERIDELIQKNNLLIEQLEKQGEQRPIKEHNICNTCDEKASCVIPCPMKLVEQKPTEWSEEDEDMCYKAIAVINRLCAEGKDYVWSIKTLKKLFYWLKSLKNRVQLQKQWKPSEEQITWLYRAADAASKDSRMKQVLNELLSDLKKLRGE